MDIRGDVDADYEASGKDGDSESNTGTPDIGGVLQALVTQMASLNVNLDGMRQSQSLILDAVRTKTNNDRSFDMATPPTVNQQSSMTETHSGIKEGKHVSLSLGGSISEKTHKMALSGEFINLCDFMPLNNMPDSSELETVVSQSGSMYVRPRKSRLKD